MKFYSCDYVQKFYLKFMDHISNARIQFCCIGVKGKTLPYVPLHDSPIQTLDELTELRRNIVNENKISPKDRQYTDTCASCRFYRLDEWNESDKITDIGLGMYPAPCQSKCCYCSSAHGEQRKKFFHFSKAEHGEYYEKIFETLDYAKKSGWMSTNVFWKVASGEISIHPYKDRITKIINMDAAMWHTNCFIYDDNIAANLIANPKSIVYPSIDCGTPETWQKIRGFDNFAEVKANLVRYSATALHHNQIYLKYIILPGLNDNERDFIGFIELVKSLQATKIEISPDDNKVHSDKNYREKSVKAAAQLFFMLSINSVSSYIGRFHPDTQSKIVSSVRSIVSSLSQTQ